MQSLSTGKTANRQIAGATVTIMLAFILSQVFGLVRQVLATRAFGTDPAMDAFTAAGTYPDLIFSLVASGALASAFIPTFTGLLNRKDYRAAWHLASSIINIIVVVLALLCLVSILIAPQIVATILAPRFPPAEQALCAQLLRIRLLAPVIFGISGLLMGILNTHQRFLLPALAPSMNWLGLILGLVFFVPTMGIYGYAWGAVLGALLHLAIQIPDLFRLSRRAYFLTFGLQDLKVRQVGILMAPRVMGVAAVQLNFLVNTILATGQPTGSTTAISVAWMLLTVPEVVIAQSIAIAALPTFSLQAARFELGEMRASLTATLRSVILLSLPASLGLILLGRPLIVLFFQHGEFTAHSTDMVMWALLWYAMGLVGHSVVEVTSRAFYAMQDTRTPVITTTIAMAINVLLSLLFSWLFSQVGWAPHGGLALANSLATTLEAATLLVLMRRRLKGLGGRSLLGGLGQAALATGVMGLAVWGWVAFTPNLHSLIVVGLGLVIGGGSYFLVTWLLKVPELILLTHWINRHARDVLMRA